MRRSTRQSVSASSDRSLGNATRPGRTHGYTAGRDSRQRGDSRSSPHSAGASRAAGQVFLDVYEVTAFEVEVWDFIVAVPLGILGAVLAAGVGLSFMSMKRISMPLARHQVARSTIGGLVLGVIAFAFPLTLFSGNDRLGVAIDDAEKLAAGLLFAVVVAKILSLSISVSMGFIGGVIFPMIFIGGTAGATLHQLIPGLPEGLAVSCLYVAVPAASARIPFTMLVLAAISLTLGSPAAAAPAGLAGIVSYVLVSGLRTPPQQASAGAPEDTPAAE